MIGFENEDLVWSFSLSHEYLFHQVVSYEKEELVWRLWICVQLHSQEHVWKSGNYFINYVLIFLENTFLFYFIDNKLSLILEDSKNSRVRKLPKQKEYKYFLPIKLTLKLSSTQI